MYLTLNEIGELMKMEYTQVRHTKLIESEM